MSKDKANFSTIFSLLCFKSYIGNDDHAQIMQILICYYTQKDKKTAQEGPGRLATYSLNQLCSSMSTQDTVTSEVWSNGCFHLHSTDASAHPLNYKWIHERRGFYTAS